MRRLILLVVLALSTAFARAALAAPIPIKVVVLTTFEGGASAAKTSGEFQAWAERLPLTHPLKVPGVEGRVLYSDDGVLGVVTGMRARARESVAALVLDPRIGAAAFEAAWRVGAPVVKALVAGWPAYAEALPQAQP